MFLSAAIFAMSMALVSSPARAQELQAMNNFHHEMAECIAFYRAIATCSANDGSKGAALTERAEKAGEALLMYYLVLGDNLGITDDAAKSRLLLSAKEMMKLINNSCMNFSSLLTRYSNKCVAISNDPAKVMKERVARAK